MKKCDKCNNELITATLTIIDGSCWKCHSDIKIAVVQGGPDRKGSTVGPDEFSLLDLKSQQIMVSLYKNNIVKQWMKNI